MASPVASRRLEIFAAARAAGPDFLRFDPARLRFSLGTSLSDLKVPVQVVREAEQLVTAAAMEVALLLATRHRRFVAADEIDRLMLREDFARAPAAAPSLGPTGGGPDLKAAAQLGVSAHPALTGGVTCVWMGPGGRGRSLTALFIEALR